MKNFKTLEEQIQLLKDRGLSIEDESMAKLYLLTNNYYNIINGYGNYFPRNGDIYVAGTTFNEITHLYVFEREIKQAIFRSIINMESHLKASFAYRFAEANKDIPYAYLNINCYDKKKVLSAISTISQLSKIISVHKKYPNDSISHYLNNYGDVPIWVLANYLDFGHLRHMLIYSTTSIQNAVAKDMLNFVNVNIPNEATFTPETMISFIENINDVRNICAHNNRLIGFTCRRDSKYWASLHDQYNINSSSKRNSIFSVFISLQCFLSKVEYANLHNRLRKQFFHLDNRIRTISINDIYEKLGFPKDWHKNSPKMQH